MRLLLLLSIPAFVFGNVDDFLERELREVNEQIKECLETMESGLDVQRYYYYMGRRAEIDRLESYLKQQN